MRIAYRLILFGVGAALLIEGTADAKSWWRWGSQPRTRPSVSRSAQRRPAGQQPGFDDEKLVMVRVRGYQTQLAREEQILNKRLAEADRLRQRGLQQKDQRLLDQAERYERRSLAAYQQRVQYFEHQRFSSVGVPPGSSRAGRQVQDPSRTRRSSVPRSRARSRSASPRRRASRR